MRRAAQFHMRQGLWTEEAGRPEAKSCPSEYPNGLCFVSNVFVRRLKVYVVPRQKQRKRKEKKKEEEEENVRGGRTTEKVFWLLANWAAEHPVASNHIGVG